MPPIGVVGPTSRTRTLLGGYLPLILASLAVLAPLAWMVLGSFKGSSEIVNQNVVWLPHNPNWDAYLTASQRVNFPRLFANSVLVTAVGATIKLVLAVLSAYALVFIRFPFKRVIFMFILAALMVPAQVSMLPNYILISGMGGVNTYWGIILPGLGTAFGTFLLRQHFMSLPGEVLEAAKLDGAGHLSRLLRIVVPISTPAIATVALVTIVDEWNSYLWPLVITNDDTRMTLPVGLTLLKNIEGDPSAYPVLMAGAVLVIVPVIVIFLFLQRYIVAGLTQGAVD
ncbi:carbohydrate ABC transporter permease [Propionibacterium freudenreichii]|uniref:carbohydrate ABC transporter permease n=1 Tax=Propionibacterium freudenreichii TaxID=1744 RepID=UPI00254C3CAB|nr:carbohydrate ABC transporter permease [Propionibacterium freudenreichii]MDK9322664.1 carbohydrate ABC transporter permease [Propionibacterium freudenreichii]MDK9325037.1 carbohydrate ABC transporter permease [Propionibacterium freudenreichii]